MQTPEQLASDILELAGFTPEMIEMAIYGDSRSFKEKKRSYPTFSGFSEMYPAAMIRTAAWIYENMTYPYSKMGKKSEAGLKYLHGSWSYLKNYFDLQLIGDFCRKSDKENKYPHTLYAGTINARTFFIDFEKGLECNGGYSGVCLSCHQDTVDFINFLLTPGSGYSVKDIDAFKNGLGGLDWSDIDRDEITNKLLTHKLVDEVF